jgi:uncharacterized protein YkwD
MITRLFSLFLGLCLVAVSFYGGVLFFELRQTEEGASRPIAVQSQSSSPLTQESVVPIVLQSAPTSAPPLVSQRNVVVPARTPSPPLLPQVLPSVPSPQIVTPPSVPLIEISPTQRDTQSALNSTHIRERTNLERASFGLPPLRFNAELEAMALTKAKDMLALQYFAHESPSGIDISGLADRIGYDYLTVGENLALGHFTSSAHVVDGWMNSPGHRANILHTQFTEIGIAAIQGIYEGDLVWFAVQAFGRPQSDCPPPAPLLAQKIDIYTTQLTTLETTLDTLRAELNQSSLDRATYEAKAKDYNTIVSLYNDIVALAKNAVEAYNHSVSAFNQCVGA